MTSILEYGQKRLQKNGEVIMRAGREIDTRVAEEVFGHEVYMKDDALIEKTTEGERSLPCYTQDMNEAWVVAQKLRVCLIPIVGGQWFAFIGPKDGWESPLELLERLRGQDFEGCGAAVGFQPAEVICQAALKAVGKRQFETRHDNVVPLSPERH